MLFRETHRLRLRALVPADEPKSARAAIAERKDDGLADVQIGGGEQRRSGLAGSTGRQEQNEG